MGEQARFPLDYGVEPRPGPHPLVLQSFELAHRPANEMFVEAPLQEAQLGAVEGPGRDRDWPWPDESGYGQPPAQIPGCGIPALGSFLRCERRSVLQDGRGAGYLQVEAIVERGVPCAPSSSDDAGCGAGAP